MNRDLIELQLENKIKQEGPLAHRMRPRNLEEFIGQEEILGEGTLLRRLIAEDRLVSMIFYGPPGTGKTTLARIIAGTTRSYFARLNAVEAGVKDLREVIQAARERWSLSDRRTILFIDEVHRFNKTQQDALLSAVEQGLVIFIGATTENPFFYLIGPLISRARLFTFKHLAVDEILLLLQRALQDREKGLGGIPVEVEPGGLNYLAQQSAGDARAALNALELAVLGTSAEGKKKALLTVDLITEALSTRIISYDRHGDLHYDLSSAFIKSIRGSDPDAALYWMVRMLEGGEDPLFIARRLIISASEDIGNADPQALTLAVSAAQAVQMVGLPEGKIPLAQAVTYLASAPKSNASYIALNEAAREAEQSRQEQVPAHLCSSGYRGAARLGRGQGYLYPHDYQGHFVQQEYLPPKIAGKRFYRPSGEGFEQNIRKRLDSLGEKGAEQDG